MKLTKNIKSKTGLWRILPQIISTKTAQCIYPFIFLPDIIYRDLLLPAPKPESIAILLHEKIHLKRQKSKGIILWIILYIFSSKFRFNEEFLAYKEQILYLRKHSRTLDLETRAKRLSSWLYLWCISYENALSELKKI